MIPDSDDSPQRPSRSRLWATRLLIGWIVFICAEMFSGASLPAGLWHPWVWLVSYWLYFAHFFFCTTLAVRIGRTSLSALYLWGVLFGLYESWITKVIWAGYAVDGNPPFGYLGPYGFSEISMVFFFHPLISFILPLAVSTVLIPGLRSLFPDLAWITGSGRRARLVQLYLLVTFAPVMAMNGIGLINIGLNVLFALALLLVLGRLAQPTLATADARRVVSFQGRGFVALCLYLALLYGLTYPFLNPDARPSLAIQALTFVFYALALIGLWFQQRRQPVLTTPPAPGERRRVLLTFAAICGLALLLSTATTLPVFPLLVVAAMGPWTPLGFLLLLLALGQGMRERLAG